MLPEFELERDEFFAVQDGWNATELANSVPSRKERMLESDYKKDQDRSDDNSLVIKLKFQEAQPTFGLTRLGMEEHKENSTVLATWISPGGFIFSV